MESKHNVTYGIRKIAHWEILHPPRKITLDHNPNPTPNPNLGGHLFGGGGGGNIPGGNFTEGNCWITVTYSWDILQFELKKLLGSDYLTGVGLTLWYIGFGFEKYSDYFTGLGLILLNTGSRYKEAKQGGRYKSRRTFLNYSFLSFNIALIHVALTAPSFGNLCMMISPSTLLCFLCSSGCCMLIYQ